MAIMQSVLYVPANNQRFSEKIWQALLGGNGFKPIRLSMVAMPFDSFIYKSFCFVVLLTNAIRYDTDGVPRAVRKKGCIKMLPTDFDGSIPKILYIFLLSY